MKTTKWNKEKQKEYKLKRCAGFHLRLTPSAYARTWKLFKKLEARYGECSVADLWENVVLLGLERMERGADRVDTIGEFAKKKKQCSKKSEG